MRGLPSIPPPIGRGLPDREWLTAASDRRAPLSTTLMPHRAAEGRACAVSSGRARTSSFGFNSLPPSMFLLLRISFILLFLVPPAPTPALLSLSNISKS